jgi:phosphoribosylamine-glycine ligase
MELYNFNSDVYNKIVEIVKFRFYKEIKDTGIVFNEILLAENLVTNSKFYVLECNDQDTIQYLRFKDSKLFLIYLIQIAQKRLKRLEAKESELLKVNDTESYGEARYFNDTEMTAIGISSIKILLQHLEKTKMKIEK